MLKMSISLSIHVNYFETFLNSQFLEVTSPANNFVFFFIIFFLKVEFSEFNDLYVNVIRFYSHYNIYILAPTQM